jgi:hypothetical protein
MSTKNPHWGTSKRTTAQTPLKSEHFETDDAQTGAFGTQKAPFDPHLATVVDAWPTLPEVIKTGILAMVRAAATKAEAH